MSTQSIYLPNYSVGEDCYNKISQITMKRGSKVVAIGGETAMSKAKDAIISGIQGSEVEILDFLWYGGDCTMENVELLSRNDSVKEAEVIFAIGGGRAVDTAKVLGQITNKPVITFPTLGSNCAACTAISVVYDREGTFSHYVYLEEPPMHVFINTKIIAESPDNLFWAGIGDALSKQYEVELSCKEKDLWHLPLLGLGIAKTCTEPLLEKGQQALEDCRNNKVSKALEEVALDIIILTGLVSNCEVHNQESIAEKERYYYNSSLAHCLYNGSGLIKKCEKHLHGEIVSFGTLCLLTYDERYDELKKIMAFNHKLNLPITLGQIEMTEEDLDTVAEKALTLVEWEYLPGNPTKEKFIQAILDTDQVGKELLDKIMA